MGEGPNDLGGADDSLPVVFVSGNDSAEFCRKLGALDGQMCRLPTEAEWEYACRAGTTTQFAGSGKVDQIAWYAGNSGGKLHPVGQLQTNQWGLFDMEGNAAEWCLDGFFSHLSYATAAD